MKATRKDTNGHGASPAATLAVLREELKTNSPSPRLIQDPPPPPEESLSLKRKREEDEAERDPNAFIEKMLKDINAVDSSSALTAPLSLDLGSQLAGQATTDSFIPPVVPVNTSAQPPSFAVLASSGPPPASKKPQEPTSSSDNFDFDWYIDSTAAGFDVVDDSALTAETPELVGGGGGGAGETPASPKLDTETDSVKKPQTSSPTKAQDLWYSSEGPVSDLAFDDLPPSFEWDITDPAVPSWASL